MADFWDQYSGTGYWQSMPAATLQELFTGETKGIYITLDTDGWFVGIGEEMGSSDGPHPLEQAKAIGDKVLSDADTAQAATLLKDAGLDASQWQFVKSDRPKFDSLLDPETSIVMEGLESFILYSGETQVGEYPSAESAAAAFAVIPAPGL